jgi:Spy/CpxP family protein refolding chaperone
MKFMKFGTAVLALFTAATLTAGAADAPSTTPPPGRGPGGPGGQGGQGGAMRLGAGLNLDEQQRTKLREAMQKDSEAIRALDEKLRAAQKELVQAAIAEKLDEKVIRAKADAVGKIQADMAVLRSKAFASIAPTLTKEQRDNLENSRIGAAMLMGGLGGGMGGGPGYGGPRGEGQPGGPGGAGGGQRRRPGAPE